jgi:hypothetical protein
MTELHISDDYQFISLAGKSGGVPAADDFVPVMVFVVIKANPPSLLSTVQYVDSFYGTRMAGEDQYWWMQFAAAIEFIKTMLQESPKICDKSRTEPK